MISKNKSKFIISLQNKKVRDEEGLYVIEGDKLVREFLAAGIPLKTLIAKKEFMDSLTSEMKRSISEIEDASYDELKHISTLKTPHNALAVVPIFQTRLDENLLLNELCVALDFVQDPGNMGTIIRAAAWFGIKNILLSEETVDPYNPKVARSTMGSIFRVRIFESNNLIGSLEWLKKKKYKLNANNII